MWFASIWIFTLRLPWALGASHFLSHLLDGDPASNTLSWRWIAGLHTPGKHYLARASNISKYTNGQFDPRGCLDERAEALPPDDADFSLRPCAEPPTPDPTRTSGLLLTGEDLTPEHSGLRQFRFAALAGGWDQQIAKDLDLSPRVAAFSRGALEDGLGRASRHFGVSAEHLTGENWINDAVAWARSERLEQVVTPYAPVGAWAERLDLLANRLARVNIRLTFHRRVWDSSLWPGARAGYFRFRKQAEPRLRELLTPQRQPTDKDAPPAVA
jgi:deoxyribodipyrimidine photo-lyase